MTPAPPAAPETPPDLDLSVVIPCLNEERTVARCVAEALEGIRAAGLTGEVIVADNGSTDTSRERAEAAGARIVAVARRGYGAALQAGFLAARGRLLVMGDADMSYDFRHIPRFVERWRETGADLVVGNRFRGGIRPGAMPWSHRLIGNPMISLTIRRFFGVPLGDCYCGLRLITREAHRRLRLRATGMEYALEMIVQARLAGLRMAETPTTLRVDGRDTPPHLKTLRDGYRSFRFLFQHAPISLYLWPGVALMAAGAGWLGWRAAGDLMAAREGAGAAAAGAATNLTARAAAGAAEPDLLPAALALMVGWTLILLGGIARMFAAGHLDSRVDPFLPRFFARWRLEHAIAAAALGMLAGAASLGWGAAHSTALGLLGLSAVVISVGVFFGSFVVSLMGRAVPDERFHLRGARPGGGRKPFSWRATLAAADPATGQNLEHSLATQRELARATRYNQWLADAVAPALRGARAALDVGCSIGNMTERVAETLRRENPAAAASETRVTGLEIIPEAAAEFRRRFEGRADMEVIEGDLFAPPPALQERAPFDAVVCFNVLEHLENDVEALRRMGDLLRPGGRIGLVVPGGGERLYGSLDALDRHYRRYTPARLAARLEEAGFEIESLRKVNFAGYFLWWFQGRVRRARRFDTRDVAAVDRLTPLFRALDRLLGPPLGQSLACVARRKSGSAP